MTEVIEAPSGASQDDIEQYRRELTGYCYRMLGSSFDAEDAVQEAMVKAWRSIDRFEGRSSLRTWLYRITTNVCLDHLNASNRRARPMDLGPAASAHGPLAEPLPTYTWVEPMPDSRVLPTEGDPAELAAERETVRLAFVAALQHLPPKQRSVLVLRDVLRWQASEVAALLETSVAAVNSAHQRARATLAEREVDLTGPTIDLTDEAEIELLERYVDCFERYDIEAFVELLHEDATQNMPPYPMWLVGPEEIKAWMLGPGIACKGSKLVPIRANGLRGFGQYRPSGPGGAFEPWAIHVIERDERGVVALNFFLDTNLFPLFGLGPTPDAPPVATSATV